MGRSNAQHHDSFIRSTTQARSTRHRHGVLAAVVIAVGLTACSADSFDSTADESAAASEEPAPGADFSADDAASRTIEAEDRAVPATAGSAATATPVADFGRDLIVDAGVTMMTSDVGAAVDDVLDIAARNGGAVHNADVTVEDPFPDGSVPGIGTIVVRIPPTQLDGLINDLRGIGTLRDQTRSVDDVTEQLIDLDIQIRQAFQSVERMEAILAETTDFDALVAAETELVRRQTAYERLLAAQRNIDDRVALSKLTIEVRYQAPGTEPIAAIDDDPGIGDAFSNGWNAFVGMLFTIGLVLAVTAPFLVLGLALGGVALVVNRWIRRRSDRLRNRHEPIAPTRSTTATSVMGPGPAPEHQTTDRPREQPVGAAAPPGASSGGEVDSVSEATADDRPGGANRPK